MKFLTGAILSAVLLGAGPAFANRGHGHGHGSKHHWKTQKHVYHHYGPPRHVVKHVYRHRPPRVVHHYYEPAPVYYHRPAAGIHVVLPNIYIPLR